MLYLRLFLSFMKIAFFSFGGLTMVPIINDEVLRYGWMTKEEVMDIVAVAEMTPGSLGTNCATFVGLRTGGILGALSASFGAMIPSLTLCMIATYFIMRLKGNKVLDSIMLGIRPVCMGMLFAVVVTLSKSTFFMDHKDLFVQNNIRWNLVLISIISGFAMFKFKLSIPLTIVLAAFLGLILG